MVLLNLTVRPTTAYNAPNKIRRITVDTSQRVEDIVSQLKLEKKGTHFYSKGRELPLNSAIASHNIQDGDILESCACPKVSAVLSAVLRDLDAVDRLAEDERTEETVRPLLDGASLDPWPDRWSSEAIKPRKICLATIKKVIQRSDRYQDTRVPPCNNLQSLCDFMQTIWRNEGTRSHNTNAHIVKSSAKNRDGKPTICWELLQNKLDQLQAIGLRVGPGQDPLEEFVKADYARHQNLQSTPRSANRQRTPVGSTLQPTRLRRKLMIEPSPSSCGAALKCSTCDSPANSICLDQGCPFNKIVCCAGCFRGNHPLLQRNHERVQLTDQRARIVTREQNRLPYVPEYKSGPYAILATLFEVSQESSAIREYSLAESRLKKLAQQRCRSNLYDHQARGRNAFACVEGLVDKGLVRKELIPGLSEAKFSLLPPGEAVGRCSLQFERALGRRLQTPNIKNERRSALGTTLSNITLLIDRREDATYAERLLDRCLDMGIETDYRDLPTGDYLFATTNGKGDEIVFPMIIERKSWSDLADSVTGRGQRRLDCVRLDRDRQCAGSCQLCRMKRSGCSKLVFIIEGARCLNRDHENKCDNENRCKYCRELAERHGPKVVHQSLEDVLNNLQVVHDCIIHFTPGYNETINSLFMIREILAKQIRADGLNFGGSTQGTKQDLMTYARFCSNARSRACVDDPSCATLSAARGTVTIVKAEAYAENIQKGKLRDFITSICKGRMEDDVAGGNSAREVVVVDVDIEAPRKRARSLCQQFGISVLTVSSEDSHSEDDVEVVNPPHNSIQILEDDRWEITKESRKGSESKSRDTPCVNLSNDSDDDAEVQIIRAPAKNDDDVSILEVHPPSRESSKKRRQACSPKVTSGKRPMPLIFLSGMYEYDKEFFEDVNKVWKAIFHSFRVHAVQQDFEAFAATKLGESGLFSDESPPLIEREDMMFWCLFVQLTTNARLRITRTSAEMCSIRSAWEETRISQAGTNPPARRTLNFEAASLSATSSCMICKEIIKINQGIVTPCRHSFHVECVSTWIDNSGKRNCPHCNFHGIGLPKDHRTEARSRQRRPPRAPCAGSCATPGSTVTAAAIREARLRRFGGGTDNMSTPPRLGSDVVNRKRGGVWKCLECTLENNGASLSCEACTAPRRSWTCSDCTLQNRAGADRCDMCSAPNPMVAVIVGPSAPEVGAINESTFAVPTDITVVTTVSTSTAKKITCGACQQQGHNRNSATPTNCPAYDFPEEIERRATKKAEAERKAREKREEAVRFEQEAENNLRAAAIREQEIRRLLEVSEQQSATFTEMAQAEAKRKHQAARRAESRARRLGG